MSVINILAPHVADMIAAGEVVERPASVVKELMENSFDAGATAVTVEIRGGGAVSIRVSDNGCGMAPEDAGIAFLRHATSKLKDESGLEAIGTMGFRGEALAAIASVSEIELLTRQRGDREGTFVALSGGDIQEMGAAGCPEGTVMTVKNLFFNTPARLKFLKSDRSEASACVQTALRCALGRPEVSVRFLRDAKEEFFSPGDGLAESAVYSLLGRDAAKDLLPCVWEEEDLSLHGFVSSPSACRGNRAAQYFYCNGRYIRSALLQSALEQAYRNSLLSGRFPACVMYLELKTSSVDVNVHPAKTEVKFSQERRVFDMVYHSVLAALTGEARIPQAADPLKPSPAPVTPPPATPSASVPAAKPVPRGDFYQHMSAETFRAQGYRAVSSGTSARPLPAAKPAGKAPATEMHAYEMPYQTGLDLTDVRPTGPTEPPVHCISPSSAERAELPVENPVQNVEKLSVPDHKIVGEVLKVYIIVEVGGDLLLIDKHAAHERIIFDRLKARDNHVMAQELLTPVTLRPSGEDRELIDSYGELLSDLGFEIEAFGEEDLILRAIPADMAPSDASAALEEICEKLRSGRVPDPQSARDEILHTVACKAAIKAGWDTDEKELERVAEAVLSGAVRYCPHGRPVSVSITRKDLDRLFKRIV